MKNLLTILATVVVLDLLLFQCANPRAPQGGPTDSIPPSVINTVPPQGTLNYQEQIIELEFDERVTADKLQSNLIITPQVDIKYKAIIKKNHLILRFESPFPDSTTMTLNFFDGITDITENNPVINLSYVFSTGNVLDSLNITGSLSDLMTNKDSKGFLVGLYPISDTLDFFTMKPYYFTTTNEVGRFQIRNIKNGTYKLLAFKDDNRNLTFEPTAESHGFISDIIQLDSNITDLTIKTLKQNVSELQLVSSRYNGRYYDARYTKGLDSIDLQPYVHFNFLSETNTLRFYKPDELSFLDSLQVQITAYDSMGFNQTDTLYIKFQESTRKPAPFNTSLVPAKKEMKLKEDFSILFSKPVELFDPIKIFFEIDSLKTISIDSNYTWNTNRTKLDFSQVFDTTSLYQYKRDLLLALSDTTNAPTDSLDTNQESKSTTRRPTISSSKAELTLRSLPGAFQSIEQDTSKLVELPFSFPKKSNNGKLLITIKTSQPSYFIELINKKFEVLETYDKTNSLNLTLPAGEYGFRILVDNNQDGKWSTGNLLQNIEPEEVYIFPEFTSLRANWDVKIDIQF